MDDSESSPPDLKALSLSVSFNGWRKVSSAFKSWALKMSSLHRPTWQEAGIFEAVMASTKRFNQNTDILLGIAERWCPDTKTFVFPWGEATITLEDVMVLLGFSVLGSPYFAALDSSGEETVGKLEKEWLEIKKDNKVKFVTQVQWMGRFMDIGDELEHAAFLGLWLSYFVFPTRYYHIDKPLLPIAVHLSRGTRIALAPPVLAHLYTELTLLKEHIRGFNTTTLNDKIELNALFKLVQAWTYERFRDLRPKHINPLLKGEPRFALWDDSKQMRTKSIARKILANSKMDSFEWRPYTKAVKNWKFPKFYPEKAMRVQVDQNLDDEFISFARCIKVSELVGIHSVEHYFPNRVASQFGLLLDVPCPVVNRNNLSKEAAWEEYNKPIDGLTLYIPSRFAEPVPSISKKRKSMKRVCKDDETQVPTGKDEGDDSLTIAQVMRLRKNNEAMCSSDENPPKVLPLLEVLRKTGKEFPEKFKRSRYLRTPTNLRSKIADSGGSASRELPLNELLQKEEVVKRKREHLGDKRAREDDEDESCMDCYEDREKGVRLEADNKDSWMSQKIAHEDETLAPLKIHQESEEEETGNKAGKDMVVSSANGNNSSDLPLSANGRVVDLVVPRPKTRQNCDDEVDVNGIKAEKKKTIVGDGTKEAKCLLQEVGENHSNEKEDVDESLKQRDLAIDEISQNLEARMMKVEKTLAKIREWKTIEKNQTKNGTTA